VVEAEREIERRIASRRAFGVQKDRAVRPDENVLGADIAVDQGEIEYQLYARGNRERLSIIASHDVARDQRQGRLEVERRGAVQGLSLLVDPPQVVTQHVVEKAFPGFEDGFKFFFQGLAVWFV